MATLSEAQILQLRPLLMPYGREKLESLVREATGERRIDTASPVIDAEAFPKYILDDASGTGYIDVLLRLMLKRPDCSPELRAAALAIFPNLAVTESPFPALVAAAVEAINQHTDQFSEAATKQAAATFAAALAQLTRYRGLHAAIMRVSNAEVPQLGGADNEDREIFLQDVDRSLSEIERALGEARAAFKETDIAMVPQTAWLSGFDRALETLRVARLGKDAGAVLDIIDDVVGQAAFMLGYFNGVIASTWGLLPFEPLGQAMAPAQQPGAPEAAVGTAPLDELRAALKAIIEEHDNWQQAYRGLVRLDRCLRAPPRNAFVAFTGAWSQTRRPLDKLIDDPRSLPWARQAREAQKNLQDILTELTLRPTSDDELSSRARAMLRGPLDDLRRICQNRFLRVAIDLKTRLGETATLQDSLSKLGALP
ncbi:hypothetical protein [Bosea sp. LjRoot237]|uniref:hypothetical protein n=1 Tax=Bosea sp. LjRoot237 TaxID=3342292 RepID=UPI003ECEA88C